jgi:hypothetical protein
MITIIHGEDLALSRKFLLDKKEKSKNPIELQGNKISLSDLMQLSTGGSLFSEEKTIIIENLLANKKSTNVKEIVDYIKINHKDFEYLLWENSELSKTVLAQFPTASVNVFKLPQNLFQFLENIRPNNKDNIIYFHKALENSNQELILYMLARQFRLMLSVLSGELTIDEVKRIAPWQSDKLKRQAKLFGEEKLKSSLKALHNIDFTQKFGQTGLNLIQAVDIFLLSV